MLSYENAYAHNRHVDAHNARSYEWSKWKADKNKKGEKAKIADYDLEAKRTGKAVPRVRTLSQRQGSRGGCFRRI